MTKPIHSVQSILQMLLIVLCLSATARVQAQVQFLEESTITTEGLYFWYADGSKAYHYAASISPRGDCMTVVNGYIFFGWYKGGMTSRDLMISRKKIGSGGWVTVQLPHKNTLIQPGNKWGDSHKTISVGVSKIDGTIHIFYDHHNDPLKYIVSKKNKAFAPDSEFTLAAFETTRGYLAVGQPVTITYPKLTTNAAGQLILNYRKGSAVGGNEMVHVYDGIEWTSNKQVTRGGGLPYVAEADKNYAYGVPYFNNGDVYYAWSVRWAAKQDLGVLNEGVYLAKCGPTMTSQWEAPNGVKYPLPIQDYSPFLIDLPASNASKGSSGGPGLVVSEDGSVHISYDGRGSGSTYQYTYTRKAGETAFTKITGIMKTGDAWNNRFYTASASGSSIRITSGQPGSTNYVTELVHNTTRSFGVSSSYISEGKLVVIVSENKQSDKKAIWSYVFQLPTENLGPASGLVARWPLDEGTGTAVTNAAGTPFTAVLENGATWGSDATRASYVSFDGTDDRIATTFKYALKSTDDFTWAWWANKQTPSGTDDSAIMVGNRYGNTGAETYEYIKFTPTNAQLANTNSSGSISTIDYPDVPQNGWHHYAMVKSGTSYQWYVDGVAQGAPVTNSYNETTPIPFLIGGDGSSAPNEHFQGYIDDVVLYRTALTGYNVAGVMNGVYDLVIPMAVLGAPVDSTSGSTWLDGLPAHSGATYLIPATGNLRSVTGNWTFPGDALTIEPGGKFQVRALESLNEVTNVGQINLNGGTSFLAGNYAEITAGTGTGATNVLDGVIVNSGYSRLVSYGSPNNRSLKVRSQIDGTGFIRIYESTTSGSSAITITNDSNTFAGTWEVSAQSRLIFANAGAVGDSNIEVTSGGRLQILGNWASAGTLTVSNAPGTEVNLGNFAWSVANLTLGGVFIANGVYTAAELNALAANPVFLGNGTLAVGDLVPEAPVAHWKLNEASGTVAVDSSGLGNSGTLLYGAIRDSDATRGSFLTFDGVDDRVATTFTYTLDSSANFTWAWWAKRSSTINPQAVMVGNRYPVGASPNIYKFIRFAPVEASFANTGDIAAFDKYNYTDIAAGGWNHYAMVKSGTSYQWYVNGVAQGAPVSLAYSETVPLPFNIGGDDNDAVAGGKETEHFQGSLDDVVLYDRALTALDVLNVRNGIYIPPAHYPPTISTIADQALNVNASSAALAFTVSDEETAAESLIVTASSSNTTLVPNSGITLGGSGSNRIVTLTPAAGQTGKTVITLQVSDGTEDVITTFNVSVLHRMFASASDADVQINPGTPPTYSVLNQTAATLAVGTSGTASQDKDRCAVIPFQLPNFGTVTNPFVSADFSVNYPATVNSPTGNVQVYGLANRSAATVLTTDYWAATANVDPAATLIQSILIPSASTNFGLKTTDTSGSASLLAYLNAQYAGGAGAGKFVFLRLGADAPQPGGSTRYTITSADGAAAGSDNSLWPQIGYASFNNTAPTIADITDRSIAVNSNTGAIAFAIGDGHTDVTSLVLSKNSSNLTLVPTANIVFGGSGANRTVTVTPIANQLGSSTLTVTVSDGALTASVPFVLTVTGSASETWRFTHFGTSANTGTAADTFDANNDGESNLLKFATGQNPTANTRTTTPTARNGANLEFTYPRSKAAMADGVIFTVEWSDTLAAATWSNAGVTEQILSDDGTVQTVKATIPAGTNGRRFVRLKVLRP